jgi:hypothetical protein
MLSVSADYVLSSLHIGKGQTGHCTRRAWLLILEKFLICYIDEPSKTRRRASLELADRPLQRNGVDVQE